MESVKEPTPRRRYNYSNVMSTLAVFLVIAGGSALAAALPKNSVKSKSVKDNSLRSQDLKDGAAVAGADVLPAEVQLRVGDSCPEGQAIRVINVDGGVICEVDDQGSGGGGGAPSGPAGGDLAGTYPDPAIANGAVNSAKVADGAVTGGDIANGSITNADVTTNATGDLTGQNIDEATLSGVDASTFGGDPPSRFLGKTSQFNFQGANAIVDTATAAAGTNVIGGDSSRFRLEVAGPHLFQLCDQLGVQQHFLYLTEDNNWIGTPSTIPDSGCTAALDTGGVSTTSAGAMVIYAPDAVIFIGPGTLNSLPGGQDPRRYNVTAFGFAIDACGAPGASCSP